MTTGGSHLDTESLSSRLSVTRSEMMSAELEATALRLFEARGFAGVTVDDIASEAHISVRTFYRYFASKEDVLQLQIRRRSAALRTALAARPLDEAPLHSLRIAYTEQVAEEDAEVVRRWITVIATTPSVVKGVLGGIQLIGHRMLAEFFGARLDLPADALVPTMLAAAAGGIVQAAQTQWFLQGGDLATMISDSLGVLERGIGTDPKTWSGGSA